MDRLLREMKRRAVDLGHGRKPPLFEQADDVGVHRGALTCRKNKHFSCDAPAIDLVRRINHHAVLASTFPRNKMAFLVKAHE